MAFKDDAQINESMDASMVDMPESALTEDQIDAQSSFRERLGKDPMMPDESESEHEYPSM